MLEAQEMFKTSNIVTRPEKALILGFMAGSRGNIYIRRLSKIWQKLLTFFIYRGKFQLAV